MTARPVETIIAADTSNGGIADAYDTVSVFLAAAPGEVRALEPVPEIVVVGQRIEDAEAALNACLARNCPANEDIDATLALAEVQILAGKYRNARTTLLGSLGRNKDVAKRYPVPLSELYRANGRVAAHLGIDRDYYRSTWGIYRSLKEGLPNADERHFTARMEIAEMMYRTRGHTRARLYYDAVARDARAVGRPDIAAIAELRSVLNHLPPYMREERVQEIANAKDPKVRAAALQAKLALARMAYERNDAAKAAAMLRDLATYNLKRPVLVYSPPYAMVVRDRSGDADLGVASDSAPGSGGLGNPDGPNGGITATSSLPLAQFSSTNRMSRNFEDMWIDVGFRITPDGAVSDLKLLRSRGDVYWAEPLLGSIRGRRYTPGVANSPASYRVERYTYTAGYEGKSDSRLAGRSPAARVEYLDLSTGGLSASQ